MLRYMGGFDFSGRPTGRMLHSAGEDGRMGGWADGRMDGLPARLWSGLTNEWISTIANIQSLFSFCVGAASVSRPSDELINVCRWRCRQSCAFFFWL